MSDNSQQNNLKEAAKKALESKPPSHYELARAHAKEALIKSAQKYNENSPSLGENPAKALAKAALAGGKEYTEALKHAVMGFVEGVGQLNPNDGRIRDQIQMNQSMKPSEHNEPPSHKPNQGQGR